MINGSMELYETNGVGVMVYDMLTPEILVCKIACNSIAQLNGDSQTCIGYSNCDI